MDSFRSVVAPMLLLKEPKSGSGLFEAVIALMLEYAACHDSLGDKAITFNDALLMQMR